MSGSRSRSRSRSSRSSSSKTDDDDDGTGVVVEFHAHDRERGTTSARARTLPRARLSVDDLVDAAHWSTRMLPHSGFFVLWHTARKAACTARLGSGVYGTVFRVCGSGSGSSGRDEEACARSCVAVKFGLPMRADGTVDVPSAKASGEWASAADAGASACEWACDRRRGWAPLRPHARMTGVSADEVANTRAITEAVLDTHATPHVVAFRRAITAPHGTFLFLEYVRPARLPWAPAAPAVGSLHALLAAAPALAAMPDLTWRALVWQALQALAALQAAFPGFRHNDAKLDNCALAPWDGADHTYALAAADGRRLAAWRLPSQRLCVKLLDFGLVHAATPALQSADVAAARATADTSEFLAFGVVPEPCDMYDAHMVLRRLLQEAAAAAPPWLPAFSAFVYAVLSPVFMVAPHVNENERLTADAQAALTAVMAPSVAALDDALAHGAVDDARAAVARAAMPSAVAQALHDGALRRAVAAAAATPNTPPALAPRHALLSPYFDAFRVPAATTDAEFTVRLLQPASVL